MARLCAALALGLALCVGLSWGKAQIDTGTALCADTLRLHVRADSGTLLDQTRKLQVRDTILALADSSCHGADKSAALAWATRSLPRIQLAAQCALAQHGANTEVRVRLVNMYFSASHYADASLPAGRYDAVRVELGDTRNYGKNWWCVLYPGLCRSACGGYAEPEENDLVCGEYIVRFRLADWWQRCTADRADEALMEL